MISNILTEFVNASLHIYMAFVFFSSFWKRKNKLLTAIVFTTLCLCLTTTQLLFKGTLIAVLFMAIFTFSLTLIFNSKILNKLIYMTLLLVMMATIENLVAIGLTVGFSTDLVAAREGLLYISGIILSKLIIFIAVILIKISKHSSLPNLYSKKYFYVFIFPLSSLAIIMLQYKIFSDNPQVESQMYYFVLIAYTALIIANMVVFWFIDSVSENIKTKHTIDSANQIIAQQTIQYQELIKHNQEVFKLRHDHKNFCVGIMAELNAGNVEEAVAILDKEYNLSKNESMMFADVVSSIIHIKQQAADENNIRLICDCVDASRLNIKPTDLAILLGNALDNAIDACKAISEPEKKLIETDISVKNDTVYIMIKNPVCGAVDVNNLVSTKTADSAQHGFGIVSMKQVAQKYNGEILFSVEDGIFTTVIMMKNI